ncbi:hypothetical protein HPY32_21680 [Nocardia terpenica]|nr:hypothetical protein [Nocardia terpenica]
MRCGRSGKLAPHPDSRRFDAARELCRLRREEHLKSADIIALLAAEPDRYPIEGRWTHNLVEGLAANPKLTGYQVYNRRATRTGRPGYSRWNPVSEWVWSPEVVHEPVVSLQEWKQTQEVTAALRAGSQEGSLSRIRATARLRGSLSPLSAAARRTRCIGSGIGRWCCPTLSRTWSCNRSSPTWRVRREREHRVPGHQARPGLGGARSQVRSVRVRADAEGGAREHRRRTCLRRCDRRGRCHRGDTGTRAPAVRRGRLQDGLARGGGCLGTALDYTEGYRPGNRNADQTSTDACGRAGGASGEPRSGVDPGRARTLRFNSSTGRNDRVHRSEAMESESAVRHAGHSPEPWQFSHSSPSGSQPVPSQSPHSPVPAQSEHVSVSSPRCTAWSGMSPTRAMAAARAASTSRLSSRQAVRAFRCRAVM